MATIKKENAIKAWKEGCSDVKRVLETLFPDIEFVPSLKYKKGATYNIKATIASVDADPDNEYPYILRLEGLTETDGDEEEITLSREAMDVLNSQQ